jgi:hypothetical protein
MSINRNTQLSLVATALILVCGAVAIGRNHATLRQVQETQVRLQQRMQESGKTSIDSVRNGSERWARRRDSEDRVANAKAVAGKVAAYWLDMQQLVKQDAKTRLAPNESRERRFIEIQEELLKLDADQLKIAIAELDNHSGLENKQHVISMFLHALVENHPADALVWYVETGGPAGATARSAGIVSIALTQLAEYDLNAAMKWLETHAASHPEWTTDESKIAILKGAVNHDPMLALQLAGKLGVKDLGSLGWTVTSAIAPEDRLAALHSWRASLPAVGDPDGRKTLQDNLLRSLAQGVVNDGYEDAIVWLQKAELSEMETRVFWAGICDAQPREDVGKWFEWAAQRFPMKDVSGYMEWQLKKCIRYDYRADGEWLNGTSEGPLKELAARSCAETLAPYEPQAASQWALTLQDDNQRQKTLQAIQREWRKKDAPAADEFARRIGLAQ